MHMDIISLEIMHDVHNLCGINQYEFHCKKVFYLNRFIYTYVYWNVFDKFISIWQYAKITREISLLLICQVMHSAMLNVENRWLPRCTFFCWAASTDKCTNVANLILRRISLSNCRRLGRLGFMNNVLSFAFATLQIRWLKLA